jgi:hypothetical protein
MADGDATVGVVLTVAVGETAVLGEHPTVPPTTTPTTRRRWHRPRIAIRVGYLVYRSIKSAIVNDGNPKTTPVKL